MLINVPETVAQRLEKLAESKDVSIGDILNDLLDRYEPQPKYATLADLARVALEADIASPEVVNTAENSREILRTEYADYLKQRLDNNDHNGQ